MLVILGQSAVALAVDCYVDSQSGIDTNSGLTDALPVKTQAEYSLELYRRLLQTRQRF